MSTPTTPLPVVAAFAPVLAAIVSAVGAAFVAWFTSKRSLITEVSKLRLAVQQDLLVKLVERRIVIYPDLYALIAEIPKIAGGRPSPVESLESLLAAVNDWDSKHAIFLGPHTTNVCFYFRSVLKELALKFPEVRSGAEIPPETRAGLTPLFDWAQKLELALRSGLGIYGLVDMERKVANIELPVVEEYESRGAT